MKLKKIIIALNLFLITFSVSAYDAIGHRIIADIAYQHLSKKAKKQCDKLLGLVECLQMDSLNDLGKQ